MSKFNKICLILVSVLFTIQISFGQNSIHFDGINDQVDCGNDPSLQITGTAITLEAWINPSSWTNEVWRGNIIVKEAAAWNGYMFRAGANGSLNFALGNGSTWTELTSDPNELTLNTWQHIAGTYDGTMMRIYVNGIPIDSLATTLSISNASAINLNIGANIPLSRFFPGRIDEARVWNVHRTEQEILSAMNTELCAQTGLVAYYQFNSGNANGNNMGVTTLTDLSGNGNNGTLANLALSGNSSNWVNGVTLSTASANTGIDVQNPSCDQYTWIDGVTYTSNNNTATYTTQNIAGCDSVVTLDLTIGTNQSSSSTDVINACSIIQWLDGNFYTANNNTATYTTMNAAGCDSVITLDLTILGTTYGTDVQTSCTAYTWINGVTYTSSNNTDTKVLVNSNGCDSIVTLNLTITTITATDVQTACGSYTWIDGNLYTSSNNTATFMLSNSNGCDSLVTLDLTIAPIDVSTNVSEISLITVVETNGLYQWLDCNNSMEPIINATNQSFGPSNIGSYAVEVTKGGCIDTSECVEITTLEISNYSDISSSILVYPNPTRSNIFIQLPHEFTQGEIKIIDLNGKIFLKSRYYNPNQALLFNLDMIPEGIYLVEINSEFETVRTKIVKQ
ncbi:MAG: LamG-like jellyroll fold domain-containing protein [Crocinitomicaceae bacterium]